MKLTLIYNLVNKDLKFEKIIILTIIKLYYIIYVKGGVSMKSLNKNNIKIKSERKTCDYVDCK